MDESEIKVSPQTDVTELQEQFDALRHLVVSMLVLVLVVSGTLTIYLMRERKYARTELEALRPQATSVIAEYEKNQGPMMDNFIKQLTEYGRTHPDFAPIMTKYGLKPTVPGSNAPAPATPALPTSTLPKK
jgi:hypothetical protein